MQLSKALQYLRNQSEALQYQHYKTGSIFSIPFIKWNKKIKAQNPITWESKIVKF